MIEINNLKKGDTAYFLVPASNEIAHGVILDYQITNNENVRTILISGCTAKPIQICMNLNTLFMNIS